MRPTEPDRSRMDHSGDRLLQELDQLQAHETRPDIEPPELIDQAVRNMARRELQNSAASPLAGKLRWIAGLSTVSIALIAVGISMVQSPGVPTSSPAPAALAPERARSEAAKSGSDKAGEVSSRDADSPPASLQPKRKAEEESLQATPEAAASQTVLADSVGEMDEARAEPAQAWLELIRQLHDQGLEQEAAEQLRAFHAEHPEYPLPEWTAELTE